MLLPAASHPRPLLPSCRCSFLWLRLSLSHELTASNGLQLPRYSNSSSPLLASDRTAHSASPNPPPISTLPPPALTKLAGPGTLGGLSARPHTLGLGLCADALNVPLWSGCPSFSEGQDRWATGKIRSFVCRAKTGGGGGWGGGPGETLQSIPLPTDSKET